MVKLQGIIAVPYLNGKGGTETVVKNFLEAFKRYGNGKIEWKLYSYGGTQTAEWMSNWNKKVYSFTNSRFLQKVCYVLFLPFLILHTLKKEKPDIFVATNPVMWTWAFYVRNMLSLNTCIIAWYHYSYIQKKINRKYLHTTDYFWAISKGIENELISYGVDSNKIYLVYNPVDVDTFSLVERNKNMPPYFIYLGRIDFDGQKNVSELIQALNMIKGEWKLDLFGTITPSTKNRLLSIASLETKKKIRFKGFKENVWNEITDADVLLLTSKYEGLGMVLIEAAAKGIYLVSSNCQVGPKEIINSKNGCLYSSGKVDELALILQKIVSKDVQLPNRKDIRKSIKKFDYYNYVNRIEKFLNNKVSEKGRK